MLVAPFLYFFGFIFYSLIAILPSAGVFPSQINTAFEWVFETAYAWNWILPIDTIITVLGLAAVFYTGVFTFQALKFILNIIRGSGA